MKIAIVTIYDYFNYGNKLQNYALLKILQEYGHEVDTLAVSSKKSYAFFMKLTKLFPFISVMNRINKSKKFTKNTLNTNIIDCYSFKKLQKFDSEYDAFIIGSDQVWNPKYMVEENVSFLRFANIKKRMAYAPSFGISFLPKEYHNSFKEGLKNINYLSVREYDGAKIIKKLTDIDVSIVLDPTLLISKKSWEEFSKKPKQKVPEKYILTYFFGISRKYGKKIKEIAKASNLKLIKINTPTCRFCKSDIREFIYLMNNAELVLTNTFHGHAMSIALEKPFISFSSLFSTNSRIKTLLQKTELNNRNYSEVLPDNYFNMDFSKARKNLETERKNSLNFLNESLNNIKTGEK